MGSLFTLKMDEKFKGILFDATSNIFHVKSKRIVKQKRGVYQVRFSINKKIWICTCWKGTNRPYKKWGYCEHILRVLSDYDTSKYNIEKDFADKCNKKQKNRYKR